MHMQRTIVLGIILGVVLSFVAAIAQAEENPTVNVNEATAEQLRYLPGIGQSKADNILYAREQGFRFKTLEDLTRVHGIGSKTAEKLKPYVVFSGPTTATGPIGKKAEESSANKFRRPDVESEG